MVVRNKIYRVFDKYRSILKTEVAKKKGLKQYTCLLNGVRRKNRST